MMKKTVSLLLAMLLALTLIPLAVFADTGTEAPSSELLASAAAEGKSVVRIVTDPADAVVDLAAGAYYPATRLGDPIEPASNHVFLLEPGYYQAKVTKEGYYTFAKVFYVKEDDLGKAKELGIVDVNKYIEDAAIHLPTGLNNTGKILSGEEELDQLVGLQSVKHMLKKIKAYAKRNKGTPDFNLHMCFYGNPGTGKTVVARILSRILYDAGALKEAKMIETDAHGLIGQYVGETAPKTQKKIDEAMNGV